MLGRDVTGVQFGLQAAEPLRLGGDRRPGSGECGRAVCGG